MKKKDFLDILANAKKETSEGDESPSALTLALRPASAPAPALRPLTDKEEAEIRATFALSRSENTDRTYVGLIQTFERVAAKLGWDGKLPLGLDLLIRAFNEAAKTMVFGSLAVLAAAIASAHKGAGLPSPTKDPAFGEYMKGLRRQRTKAPKKAYFFEPEDLWMAWDGLCNEDRIVLYTAVFSGFRREALCSIEVENVEIQAEGISILITKDKTIKDKPHLAFFPAVLPRFDEFLAFVKAAKENEQTYLFPPRNKCEKSVYLNARTFCRLVKRAAKLCGKEDACTKYSGHSTRRGLAKALARRGERMERISQILGHKDPKTTIGYLEEHEITTNSPLLRLIEKEEER